MLHPTTRLKYPAILFWFCVIGLLFGLRLNSQPQDIVSVTRVKGSLSYAEQQKLKRGQIIQTNQNEFVKINIGDSISIALDENSTIDLKKIFKTDHAIGFTRGRILVEIQNQTSLNIETLETRNFMEKGIVEFENDNTRRLISIIPTDETTIKFQLKNGVESREITTGTTVREIPPITFTKAEFHEF